MLTQFLHGICQLFDKKHLMISESLFKRELRHALRRVSLNKANAWQTKTFWEQFGKSELWSLISMEWRWLNIAQEIMVQSAGLLKGNAISRHCQLYCDNTADMKVHRTSKLPKLFLQTKTTKLKQISTFMHSWKAENSGIFNQYYLISRKIPSNSTTYICNNSLPLNFPYLSSYSSTRTAFPGRRMSGSVHNDDISLATSLLL